MDKQLRIVLKQELKDKLIRVFEGVLKEEGYVVIKKDELEKPQAREHWKHK